MQSTKNPKPCQGQKKIDKYIFSLKAVIGQGAYATVYLGRTLTTSQPVAIKVIDRKVFSNSYNLKNLHLEIDIMKKLHHQNIVALYDVYQTPNNMYIVTEYCEEGDLAGLLKRRKRVAQVEAVKMLRDIMEGFQYLVGREITHRDLKPANILMKQGRCKIGDFGFAKNLQDGDSTVMKSIVGTPLYMSPQILSRMKYTNKSDLWSIGLIYYQLLHGYTPWPAKNQVQLVNSIMSKPIHFEANISEASRDFIRRCLRVKEEDRLGWEEAFNHGLLRPEKRKGIMGGAVVGAMEEDKENINVNILGRESRSLKMRRDVSENKIKMPMQNIKTPKTPTRSRLTQILALTPSREGQGERPSFVKKPNFNKTESSLNIRPRFK